MNWWRSSVSTSAATAAIVAVLIAALAVPGAKADSDLNYDTMSSKELFKQCVCWDTNANSFCGGTDFWREPCKKWAWRAALWAIPAAALFVFYLFFPFIFFVFRCVCNLCGGRQPSYGCCCPDDHMCGCGRPEPSTVPGSPKPVRVYSNRAIFLTKFFFCMAFGVQIYYAVGSYVNNAQVNNDAIDLIDAVHDGTVSLNKTMTTAGSTFELLEQTHFPHVDPAADERIWEATRQYSHRISQIDDVLRKLRNLESNQSWGRAASTYRIPSLPLTLGLIAFVCMLCNLRGAHLTIAAGLLSWCVALVTVGFFVHMVLAQISTAGCSTYNTTVVGTLVGAIESNEGCNTPTVLEPIAQTASGFQADMCTGTTDFIGFNSLCTSSFRCDTLAACSTPAPTGIADVNGIVGIPAFSAAPPGSGAMCLFPANYTGNRTCSIANCALFCVGDNAAKQQSIRAMAYLNKFGENVEFLATVAYEDFQNCTAVRTLLYGPIHDRLCGTFNESSTSLAVTLLAQMINGFALMIVMIVGAKRFQKMNRSERERENIVYGLLLTEDEAHRYVGSPIGSPQLATGTPIYGATASGGNDIDDFGNSCNYHHSGGVNSDGSRLQAGKDDSGTNSSMATLPPSKRV